MLRHAGLLQTAGGAAGTSYSHLYYAKKPNLAHGLGKPMQFLLVFYLKLYKAIHGSECTKSNCPQKALYPGLRVPLSNQNEIRKRVD